jgi:flagellar hook assembly protein FlgD
MKTNSIFTAVLMVIGVAVASAQTVAVEKKSSNVFKITYKDETAGKVKVSIFNAAGTEVFAETFKEVKSFARPLNFGGMEQGEYTVEVVANNGKKVEKINYTLESSLKNVHLAKIANESKYVLAVTSAGTEPINVKIFDSANQLVLDENKNSNNGFATVYNMKNLSGAFTIEVSDLNGNTKTVRY